MTNREKELKEASERCKTQKCEGCPLASEHWCEYAVDMYREEKRNIR